MNRSGTRPSDPRHLFGREGEACAARWLESRGYRIIERNFRTPGGEVDIIARDGDTIVFIEVKSRRTATYGVPQLAVTPFKQRQIIRAARWWLQRERLHDQPARFDVVAVTLRDGEPVIELIRDAFEAE